MSEEYELQVVDPQRVQTVLGRRPPEGGVEKSALESEGVEEKPAETEGTEEEPVDCWALYEYMFGLMG